ncbi:uncharacterized protein LOC133191637 [Saccostrea echinata]|uniref:uncharacterized protein LOC133191637 n=1 Tax=Saccostrea echinata TaxID=191078 RepID=UPI002A82E8C5|nr:uncharacterized protein LOC133191637 [Saccostrea echinata]
MDIKDTLFVVGFLHISFGMNEEVITSKGHYWPWGISQTLQIMGRKQCTRECQMRISCQAVNYKAETLQCEILSSTPNNLTDLADNNSYEYIAMSTQTTVFSSSACNSSCGSTFGLCVRLSSGLDYCINKYRTCPSNYRYSPALNFCYRPFATQLDFATARSHCESLGDRLAVLPTMAHVNFIKGEKLSGHLDGLKYWLGGQWDFAAGDWRWLDGSLIFNFIDISLCRILKNFGAILWEKKYNLMDRLPSRTEKFLCEKVLD